MTAAGLAAARRMNVAANVDSDCVAATVTDRDRDSWPRETMAAAVTTVTAVLCTAVTGTVTGDRDRADRNRGWSRGGPRQPLPVRRLGRVGCVEGEGDEGATREEWMQ